MFNNIFLPFSIMFISTALSLYKTFTTTENQIDYYPTTLDKYKSRKLLWYFSHFTFSNGIFLLSYFGYKLFSDNYNIYFITIAPISLSVNINYFLILYPKKNIKLYELPYYSFSLHFMTLFIIFNELQYIKYNSIYEIFYYNYFILYGALITFFNFYIRKVWTYGIVNLYTLKGWGLFFHFSFISLFSSSMLYSIKYIL